MSGSVASEVLEAEFNRFVEAMDLDVDPKGLDDDDKAALASAKRTVMRDLERGKLVIDADGQPVFTPSDGKGEITFREPNGGAIMAVDQKKQSHGVARQYALIAGLTGENQERFAKMPSRDLKLCNALVVLFLG
jgi:hypothetical protein